MIAVLSSWNRAGISSLLVPMMAGRNLLIRNLIDVQILKVER